MTASTEGGLTAVVLRRSGATAGVVAAMIGGAAAGGLWWPVALLVAGSAGASLSSRQAGVVHAVATIALSAGVLVAGRAWVIPLLVAGVIGCLESAAAADRTSVVRTRVRPRPALESTALAVVAAGLVLGVGTAVHVTAVPLVLVAVIGGGAALVAITR